MLLGQSLITVSIIGNVFFGLLGPALIIHLLDINADGVETKLNIADVRNEMEDETKEKTTWLFRAIYNFLFGTPKATPPVMFSEGKNVYKWIGEFEEYLRMMKCKDSRSQCKEIMKLLDPASSKLLRHACKCYDDKKLTDYEMLKNQMLQLFVTARVNQRELRFKFYNRLQKPDESIHRYNHELTELAVEAYPLCDKKMLDTMIYEQLLYGLYNSRIRNQLMNDYGTNTDLSEVIRVAKIQEECEMIEKARSNIKINNVSGESSETTHGDSRRNEKYGRSGDNRSGTFDTIQSTNRTVVCWNCGNEGHTVNYCNKPRSDNNRHFNNNRNNPLLPTLECNNTHLNEGRPKQYSNKFTSRAAQRSPNRRNDPPIQANVVSSSTLNNKREIKGYCSLNGKPVPFLVDTGASRSVVSQRLLESTSELRPFTSQATTANGDELKIKGIQDCIVKIGDSSCLTSVLVAPDLQQDLLIGMDVLNSCEATKEHVEGLREAIKTASDRLINSLEPGQFELIQINEIAELPFHESEYIEKLSTEEKKQMEDGFVIIQSKEEIETDQKNEWLEQIQLVVQQIEAKGIHDLTLTNAVKHSIEIIPGVQPIKQKRRPVPPHYMDSFKNSILEMEKAGLIEPARSPWSSPIHIVRKEDNTIRITQDFKKLNSVTIKDAYPLPNIESMFCHLSKAKVFSKLDLTHGYWQISMDEESRKYTAFGCEMGFYQFKVLPMGLTNACATFQRMMDKVLGDLIGVCCFVYLDDVIVFSEDDEQHVEHVKKVVACLKSANLKIKLKKCEFAVKKIEYLSHIIQDGRITPNPKKVAHVRDMKPPKTIRRLKGFLGYSSYYRRYIKGYSSIASPMIRSTIRTKHLNWSDECQLSFDKMKDILTSDLVLQLPNFKKPFRLDTDACDYGIGASLEQPANDDCDQWRPVAFYSKHLSETQQKYSTTERELLAIVLSCEHFRQMLYGVKFKVYTDHQPLKALLTSNELSPRLARWLIRLEMFDMEILYREGKRHGNADGLSRMAVEPFNEDDDEFPPPTPINNISFVEIEDEDNFNKLECEELAHEIIEGELESLNVINIQSERADQEQVKDHNIVWIYNILKAELFYGNKTPYFAPFANKEQECFYRQRQRLRIVNKLVYREYIDDCGNVILQYIVPLHLRRQLMEKAHNSAFGAHQGRDKMLSRLTSRCYWPKQYEEVAAFVKNCHECQSSKPPSRYNVAELMPILSRKPLEIVNSDIMGPLNLTSEGNRYILVLADHFTKWMELFSLKTLEAREVANKISTFVCRHGVPLKILTDQGTNYQSKLITELYELLDIERARTSPYHPETDGVSERDNRTNKAALTTLVNEKQDNWDELLPFVQFAFNSSVHATTKCTPFELMYGRKPRLPLDLFIPEAKIDLDIDPEDFAANLQSNLAEAYRLVQINRDARMEREKISYDRRVRAANYNIGDNVLLLDETKKSGTSNKFKKRWCGPFKITEKNANGVNYKIKPITKNGRPKWVHQNKLKTYFMTPQLVIKEEPHEVINIQEDNSEKLLETEGEHALETDAVGESRNMEGDKRRRSPRCQPRIDYTSQF